MLFNYIYKLVSHVIWPSQRRFANQEESDKPNGINFIYLAYLGVALESDLRHKLYNFEESNTLPPSNLDLGSQKMQVSIM